MINAIFDAPAAKGAAGVVRFLILVVFLMLVFCCVNTYKHIKSSKWTSFQKITDISGIVFFIVIIVILIIPVI